MNLELFKTTQRNGTKQTPGLLVTCGGYQIFLNVPIGKDSMEEYQDILSEIEWIRNPRFKVYVFAKMAVTGESIENVMNRIMDKGHLYDPEYTETLNP